MTPVANHAPYYQMRSGQFINSTNAAPPQFVPDQNQYDLSTPTGVASPLQHHLHPHMYTEHSARQTSADHTLEENHNLVELLEAATAADQVAEAMNMDRSAPAAPAVSATPVTQGRSKRKRASTSPARDASHQADETVKDKRRRVAGPTDPQLQPSDRNMCGTSVDGSVPPSCDSLLHDARAAGVHSAAALFRRSSERTSRKYTRPPMSKLFMSLQLSPEYFLQLQASAKAYMLDPTHPERQNCVGNRGKGDTDMVKLRLFNCVRDFLNDRVGEQFFGEHVEKPGEKDAIEAARALGEEKTSDAGERLTWPGDGNKIISLVTPLMRRMVTNERQRQYAIETRKGGAKKKDKEGSVEATEQVNSNRDYEQQALTTFDSGLGQHVQPAQPSSPSPSTPTLATVPLSALRKHKPYADLRGAIAESEANAAAPPSLKVSVPMALRVQGKCKPDPEGLLHYTSPHLESDGYLHFPSSLLLTRVPGSNCRPY
jgi:hypothetical protein